MNFGLRVITHYRDGSVTTPTFIGSICAANGVGSNSTTGAAGGATSINTTGATLICAMLITHTSGSTPSWSFSDSAGNSWSYGTTYQIMSDIFAVVAYCIAPTTSTTHSFTSSYSESFATVFAFGTSSGWALDAQVNGTSIVNSPVATGSISPGFSDEVILAAFGDYNAEVSGTVNNSFTGGQGVSAGAFLPQLLSGGPCVGGGAYLIQGAKTSTNTTFTFTPTGSGYTYGSLIVSFSHTV